MSIRKCFVVYCDAQGCRAQHVWPDHPVTEHAAVQDALNEGWSQRTTSDRSGSKVEHFCPAEHYS